MQQVWLSAAGLFGATVLGSLIGFGVKGLSHRWSDTVMGFCAGVMLAASVLGLLLPAGEMAGRAGCWQVAVGVLAGALFLNVLDYLTPHLHHLTGIEQEPHAIGTRLDKVMLFVLAIGIHKLPEGIATGVGFNAEDLTGAWTVAAGIALQNVPEGMVVIAPLLLAGVSRARTFFISMLIAVLEFAGVWIGFALGAISQLLLPVLLSFAGGAMLYVISDEMIPETHAHGYQKQATFALLVGFMTVQFMELLLG